MIYGSVCSGIEAASVAWQPLGWGCAFVSEIEPFCNAVLAHRFPGVPNYGDFTKIGADAGPIDLLVGGTPCQSFSVAGLRGGMDDDRGQLALEFLNLARRLRPRWIIWENVPGVLSSNGGWDFGTFLGGLGQCGYGFAYRVLDAQFFGVPQRRRRVFVVGYLGDWRPPAAVLFEPSCLSGNPSPCRETGQGVAFALAASVRGSGDGHGNAWNSNYVTEPAIAPCLTRRYGKGADSDCTDPLITHTLRAEGQDAGDLAPTLRSMEFDDSHQNGGGQVAVAFDTTQITSPGNYSQPKPGEPCHPLASGAHPPAVAFDWQASDGGADDSFRGKSRKYVVRADGNAGAVNCSRVDAVQRGTVVRRLTPVECERLQGFPDGWTDVPYRGKPAADANRYRALGNSMAVPVMRWIGERIQLVEQISGKLPTALAIG